MIRTKLKYRILWIGAGVVGGLIVGLLFTQVGSGRSSALFYPGGSAHAAQGGRAMFSVADVAERSLPSVVNISIKLKKQQARGFRRNRLMEEFFRHFGPRRPTRRMPSRDVWRPAGSGVIIRSNGIVITNNHVVKQASKVRVTLSDGRKLIAKIIGADPKSDLAVLKIKNARGLKAMALGDSDKLRLGDVVLAIGNPFAVGQTVTMGIVSAKGRSTPGLDVDYQDFIQTDAAINPGNSGGAMINMRGELVGINTAILSRSGGYQGIGYAIPSNMVRPITDSLLKRGRVIRGWLGVVIQPVDRELARAMKLPTHKGVLVSDVDPSGPAYKSGIKRGDLVVKINGKKVDTVRKLRNLVASAGAHVDARLDLFRSGKLMTRHVKLAELPKNLRARMAAPPSGGGRVQGGISVVPLDRRARQKLSIPAQLKFGVVVESVGPKSAAARAGLLPGDVILEVNRAKIGSVRSFSQSYNGARGQVLLLIYRRGSTIYMTFKK